MHTQFEGDSEDVALRFIYGNVNPKLGARRMSEYPNCTVLKREYKIGSNISKCNVFTRHFYLEAHL